MAGHPRRRSDDAWDNGSNAGWSLVGLLVLIAAIMLLFTGRYPKPIYDLILGMDRWALRVGAYAGADDGPLPAFPARPGRRRPGFAARVAHSPDARRLGGRGAAGSRDPHCLIATSLGP